VLATRPSIPQTAVFALEICAILDHRHTSRPELLLQRSSTLLSVITRGSNRVETDVFLLLTGKLQKFGAQIAFTARTAALGRRRFQPEIAAARQPPRAAKPVGA
jgi:hypothetical protein